MLYGSQTILFDNQLEIDGEPPPFSRGGDSGSLIINQENKAVGLLFAATHESPAQKGLTYVNPIGPVLSYFKATLIT